MTALVWDDIGERRFETGIDRCILFLPDGRAAAWNGVTSVEHQPAVSSESYYLDGVKYMERQVLGDFAASLKAYTYPAEFDEVMGMVDVFDGLSYHDQPHKNFHLVYRTRIGNDIDGADHGYKIHILYNVIAIPDSYSYESAAELPTPTQFGWTLKSTPEMVPGYRPVVHISMDSTKTEPVRLAQMEKLLYGTATTEPNLLDPVAFTARFRLEDTLVVTDNGDGTWTATDFSEAFITMTSPTEFVIDNVEGEYLDAETYTITDTIPE